MKDQFLTRGFRIAVMALLVLGSVFLLVHTFTALGWHRNKGGETTPQITVQGTGEAFAIPTTATFTFGVIETAQTVEAAQKQATDRINKAIEYVKGQGVAEKDIKTIDYNVYPQYTYGTSVCNPSGYCPPGKQTINGYQVTQNIEVKVTDGSKAPTLIAGIGNLGLQNISGLNFTVEDDNAVQQEARQKAIADAKAKAEVLARDLGVKLGQVVDFQEATGGVIPYYAKAANLQSTEMDGAAAPMLPGGQNKVTSNITIVYEIR